MDVALKEVADGKLSFEMIEVAPVTPPRAEEGPQVLRPRLIFLRRRPFLGRQSRWCHFSGECCD